MKTTTLSSIIILNSIPCLINAWVVPKSLNNNIRTTFSQPTCLEMASNRARGPGGGRQSKKQVDEMLQFMNEPVPVTESVDQSKVQPGSPSEDDLAPLIKCIAKAADMRKADEIVAMRISKVSTVANFIVVCSGNSRPQNQAIAAAIKDDVEEAFGGEHSILGNGVPEGSADSGWILLDFGDVIVHIMTPKSRLFYDIEGQWKQKDVEYMDISDVLLPNSGPMGDKPSQVGGTMEGISEEDDPFWS